jgi:predicted RNase H-like HicB family nuclease
LRRRLRFERRAAGAVTKHYVAFFVPSHVGEWRVLFPDLPDCKAYGFTLQDAAYAAASALARCAEQKGALLTRPRSVAEISEDRDWLAQQGVQLEKTIITIIPVAFAACGRPAESGYLASRGDRHGQNRSLWLNTEVRCRARTL